jgi:hypothetical protein
MSNGLLEILRYFFLALLWLFFIYAARMVLVEVRRGQRAAARTHEEESASSHDQHHDFRLRVVEPKGRRGEVTRVSPEVTFGRSPTCTVVLDDDAFASSVHARVFTENGHCYVEDLNSKNGTYLNEEPLDAVVPLERGDLIRIGGTVFEVRR